MSQNGQTHFQNLAAFNAFSSFAFSKPCSVEACLEIYINFV